MSQATKDILMRVKKMVPPLLEKFHKGSLPLFCLISLDSNVECLQFQIYVSQRLLPRQTSRFSDFLDSLR